MRETRKRGNGCSTCSLDARPWTCRSSSLRSKCYSNRPFNSVSLIVLTKGRLSDGYGCFEEKFEHAEESNFRPLKTILYPQFKEPKQLPTPHSHHRPHMDNRAVFVTDTLKVLLQNAKNEGERFKVRAYQAAIKAVETHPDPLVEPNDAKNQARGILEHWSSEGG